MVEYYIPEAIRLNSEKSLSLFDGLDSLVDNPKSYAEFDYNLYRSFTFVANKPIYGLILNSFKDLYYRVAELFFSEAQCRQLTFNFYHNLKDACRIGCD